MTPAEILDRAADLIDERGLCKGGYINHRGSLCAYGALNVAIGNGAADDDRISEADLALAAVVVNVATWNDAPERTKDEVTSTMRAVAATLRAQSAVETVTA